MVSKAQAITACQVYDKIVITKEHAKRGSPHHNSFYCVIVTYLLSISCIDENEHFNI